MTVSPLDDLPHAVAPQALMAWKENWCFCVVDVERATAAVFHFSLRPTQGEGIFSAKLAGEGFAHKHVGRAPIPIDPTGLAPVADERLSFEVVEPGGGFAIRYRSDEVDVDLRLRGRFAPFDFADGPKAPGRSTLGEIGLSVFPFHHYEQALDFEGHIAIKAVEGAGRTVEVSGRGNRDHSWGFRDDFQFLHHHWLCASFDERYVQGSSMLERSYPDIKHGGFVSRAHGNDPVSRVDASDAYWLEPGERMSELRRDVRYGLETVGGERLTVIAHVSDPIAVHHLDARSEDRSKLYEDRQVFCRFTVEETCERGAGLLELGKYHEGLGVAVHRPAAAG